jgi:hypothetical protein
LAFKGKVLRNEFAGRERDGGKQAAEGEFAGIVLIHLSGSEGAILPPRISSKIILL